MKNKQLRTILRNDFHNASVKVRLTLSRKRAQGYQIGQTSYYRIFNALCGSKDCLCGTVRSKGQKLNIVDKNNIYIDVL